MYSMNKVCKVGFIACSYAANLSPISSYNENFPLA